MGDFTRRSTQAATPVMNCRLRLLAHLLPSHLDDPRLCIRTGATKAYKYGAKWASQKMILITPASDVFSLALQKMGQPSLHAPAKAGAV